MCDNLANITYKILLKNKILLIKYYLEIKYYLQNITL